MVCCALLCCGVLFPAVPLQEYEDVRQLKSLVQRHLKFTGSQVARQILLNWDKERVKFVKVGQDMLLWARSYADAVGQKCCRRCDPGLLLLLLYGNSSSAGCGCCCG